MEIDQLLQVPTFRDYVSRVQSRFRWYRHCVELGSVLQRVADGELKRVMILEPPRHGKSELASKLFSGYFLRRNPEKFVAIASHTAELAQTLSRYSQQYFSHDGGAMRYGAEGVKHWETLKGGGLWACGIGGPATGKGFDLGIIDDPIKSAEDAQSPVYRRRMKDWYESVWTTRREPDAAEIIIQTRWDQDDLSGWILSLPRAQRDDWYIVNLAAIYEGDIQVPEGCALHRDWRNIGDALCPERYPIDVLEKLRAGRSYWFGALYQQQPRWRDGDLYKRAELYGESGRNVITEPPLEVAKRVRYWDRAGSEAKTADRTAGFCQARDKLGLFVMESCVAGRWNPFERDEVILRTAQRDREIFGEDNEPQVIIERQIGVGGKEADTVLGRKLAGFRFRFDNAATNKAARNQPFYAQHMSGNIRWVRECGLWQNELTLEEIYDELCSFAPDENGKNSGHDDVVDSISGGHNSLSKPRAIPIHE